MECHVFLGMAGRIIYAFPLRYYSWRYRGTHLLLDRDGHIVGVLLGQPKDTESWCWVHNNAFDLLQNAASRLSFSDQESSHRRGSFPSIAHGISFGGGQRVGISIWLAINRTKRSSGARIPRAQVYGKRG
jgi:hypothetical protein